MSEKDKRPWRVTIKAKVTTELEHTASPMHVMSMEDAVAGVLGIFRTDHENDEYKILAVTVVPTDRTEA